MLEFLKLLLLLFLVDSCDVIVSIFDKLIGVYNVNVLSIVKIVN